MEDEMGVKLWRGRDGMGKKVRKERRRHEGREEEGRRKRADGSEGKEK